MSGLIKCEHCGHNYFGQTTNSTKCRTNGEKIRTFYYACGGAVSKGESICKKQLVRKDEFEQAIIARIKTQVGEFLGRGGKKKLKKYLVAEAKAEYQVPRNHRKSVEDRLEKIKADIDRLIGSLTPTNKEFVDEKLGELGRERRELQNELENLKEVPEHDVDIDQLTTEIIGSMEGFGDVFKEGTLAEKKEFIRLFVDKIKLDAAGKMATLYIRKFPAPSVLIPGILLLGLVAGARSEHQKTRFPPVKVVDFPLERRGNILVPIAA